MAASRRFPLLVLLCLVAVSERVRTVYAWLIQSRNCRRPRILHRRPEGSPFPISTCTARFAPAKRRKNALDSTTDNVSDASIINGNYYSTSLLSNEQNLRFMGVGRLYSESEDSSSSYDSSPESILQRLQQSTVAVIGLGGVGSWAAEALCRSGIGHLVLIDLDDVCISNTNRQLHATSTTVGKMKIDVMAQRLREINPQIKIQRIHDFLSLDNVHEILESLMSSSAQTDDDENSYSDNIVLPPLTLVLDAIDGAPEKSALLAACTDLKVAVVTCGGAAGRMDPTKIVCRDLTDVTKDKLLATVRKTLRKYHGFEQGLPFHQKRKDPNGEVRQWNIDAVYSLEEQKQLPPSNIETSSLRRCDSALGTACFVTGTYGFVAAAQAVQKIATNSVKAPTRGLL